MERIREALRDLPVSRFLTLYGVGVTDTFLTETLQEVDLPTGLDMTLRAAGYQRVIFVSPTRPLFFLDEASRQLSRSLLWATPDEVGQSWSLPQMQPGPYGEGIVLPGGARFSVPQGTMGDSHLLRVLDAILREESGPASAVVFCQAENFIRHNQDVRTLAGLLGDWVSLPASNPNRCVFLFSANDYAALAEIAAGLPTPELRAVLLRPAGRGQRNLSIHCLGGPHADEAVRLLEYAAGRGWAQVDPAFRAALMRTIQVEGESLQTWAGRLASLDQVDRAAAARAGWCAYLQEDSSARERLRRLTGLDVVKQRIEELASWAAARRQEPGRGQGFPLLHMVFAGNPGTGKTSVARLLGELFFELGILPRGQLVEAQAAELVAEHVGGTAIKTNQVIDQALGGVLFIDEAYALSAGERGGFGAEAVETLLTRMEDQRDALVVILAGYPDPIRAFLQSNPGLARRFPVENRFEFPDFSAEALDEILAGMLAERGLTASTEVEQTLHTVLAGMAAHRGATFGNAGEVRNLVDSLERRCLSRLYAAGSRARPARLNPQDLSAEYRGYLPGPVPPLETLLAELDALVGLDEVKQAVRRKAYRLHFERLRSPTGAQPPLEHLVFVGNPGTGKTSVARLLGHIYAALGLLRKGHIVEVAMPDLVAGYVGQTAGKVMDQVDKATDGVLFIDEAYALVRGNSFFQGSYGQEVVDTLVKAIEDRRGRLLVIMAGYAREMETLLRSNPGLRSRFAPPLVFPDLTAEGVGQLLASRLERDRLRMPGDVLAAFVAALEDRRLADPTGFGNAREALAAYERVKDRLAERVLAQGVDGWDAPGTWLEIERDDLADDPYTVVVAGPAETAPGSPARLKSWVVPRE